MPCRLCGEPSSPFIADGTPYEECQACGYVQLDERRLPTPERERERYLLHRNSSGDAGYRSFIMDFIDVAARFIAPGASVLDFGSGPEPVPARLLAGLGYGVTMYDPLFAPGDHWRTRAWDAIMLHEVAEHLARPGPEFAMLAALLAPGGVLCVRTRFPPERRQDFAAWHYRHDETHVGFFSVRTAMVLASRLDLAPLLVEEPDRIILGGK